MQRNPDWRTLSCYKRCWLERHQIHPTLEKILTLTGNPRLNQYVSQYAQDTNPYSYIIIRTNDTPGRSNTHSQTTDGEFGTANHSVSITHTYDGTTALLRAHITDYPPESAEGEEAGESDFATHFLGRDRAVPVLHNAPETLLMNEVAEAQRGLPAGSYFTLTAHTPTELYGLAVLHWELNYTYAPRGIEYNLIGASRLPLLSSAEV